MARATGPALLPGNDQGIEPRGFEPPGKPPARRTVIDGAGEGRPGNHGQPGRRGRRCAAEGPHGENEGHGWVERITPEMVTHEPHPEPPSAEVGVQEIPRQLFLPTLPRRQIDAQQAPRPAKPIRPGHRATTH